MRFAWLVCVSIYFYFFKYIIHTHNIRVTIILHLERVAGLVIDVVHNSTIIIYNIVKGKMRLKRLDIYIRVANGSPPCTIYYIIILSSKHTYLYAVSVSFNSLKYYYTRFKHRISPIEPNYV